MNNLIRIFRDVDAGHDSDDYEPEIDIQDLNIIIMRDNINLREKVLLLEKEISACGKDALDLLKNNNK